jgi:hypothetical protein
MLNQVYRLYPYRDPYANDLPTYFTFTYLCTQRYVPYHIT